MPDPLSSGDLENQPAREVGFYGGVRSGWEKARSGLEEVIQHLGTLMERDPDNVRLQRYIGQVQKLLEKTHKLQMRAARVRDRLTEKKKPLEYWSPGSQENPRTVERYTTYPKKKPQGGPGTTRPPSPWTILKGLGNG